MIIVKAPVPNTLHNNTVRWLAEIAGDLQRQVTRLEKENIRLREELKQRGSEAKVMAVGAGQ